MTLTTLDTSARFRESVQCVKDICPCGIFEDVHHSHLM